MSITQDQQRHRRRQWMRVHYTGTFDLAAEIAAIAGPLAAEISYLPNPLAMSEQIDDVVDAIHEVLSTVVGMLAESAYLDRQARARTAQAAADLAQRPRQPQFTAAQIGDGSWAAAMTDHVSPYSADLAAFLGRALPPRANGLKGPSASERLEAALRVLDTAALAARRRIPNVAARQALGSVADFNLAARERRDRQRAHAALHKLGASR